MTNETTRGPAKPAAQSAGVNITLWVLQVLTAAVFAFSAAGKFTGGPEVIEFFDQIGGDWLRYLVGTLEIAGAVGLLIPRLSGLAGLAFTGLMAGAIVSHLIAGGSFVPAVLLLILTGLIAWGRRRQTMRLLGR